MEGLLLPILIPLVLVLLVGLGVVMLLDVALLGGDRSVEEREREARTWRPPFIRGAELLSWARGIGAGAIREALGGRVGPETPARLSERLHGGATWAMLPTLSGRDATRQVPCPEGGQGCVGITALEAIAIAEHVRATLPPKRREAILRQARDSADRAATRQRGEAPVCALQGEDCVCLAWNTRPLRCRPQHASTLANGRGPGAAKGSGPAELEPHEDVSPSSHARLVAEGVEEGVVRALEEAGFDGKVYELNSALAVALETPDVAERWAAGEDVFDTCLPAPESALLH